MVTDELQQLLDEAAGLMGWVFVFLVDREIGPLGWQDPKGLMAHCQHPIEPTLDSILAAFEEALPGWRFQLKSRGDGQFIWILAMGTPGYDSKVFSVACTGHTAAAWRLDLARLLVAALRAKGWQA